MEPKQEREPLFTRDRCKQLRRRRTEAEDRLWRCLRRKHLHGAKFRRQHPVGPFILDFYCAEALLAVELDGDQHAEPEVALYDARRTHWLSERGIRVLRFGNRDVFCELEGVLTSILAAVTAAFPSPRPSPGGGGSSPPAAGDAGRTSSASPAPSSSSPCRSPDPAPAS